MCSVGWQELPPHPVLKVIRCWAKYLWKERDGLVPVVVCALEMVVSWEERGSAFKCILFGSVVQRGHVSPLTDAKAFRNVSALRDVKGIKIKKQGRYSWGLVWW